MLSTAVAAHATGILPVLLVGALAVQIRADIEMSTDQLGLAVTAFYAAAAATSIPGGLLVERLGTSTVIRGGTLLLAVSCLGVAVGAQSWGLLLPWLVLSGAAAATSAPAVNLFLARSAVPQRLGTAFGVRQPANPVASLLAGLAVPALALTVGWRWAFVCAAGLALLAAALVPRERSAVRQAGQTSRERPRRSALPLVLLSLGFCLGAAAASSLGAFLVSAGVEAGLSRADAGLTVALASFVALVVRLSSGSVVDRQGSRDPLVVVAAMLGVGALGYLGLSLAARGPTLVFVPAAVVALSIGWGWNGLFNFAVVRHYTRAEAWATAVTQIGAHAGGVMGPLTFGLIVTNASFGTAWLTSASEAALAVGLMAGGGALLRRERAAGAHADVEPAVRPEGVLG